MKRVSRSIEQRNADEIGVFLYIFQDFCRFKCKYSVQYGVSNRLQCQDAVIISPKTPTEPPPNAMVG